MNIFGPGHPDTGRSVEATSVPSEDGLRSVLHTHLLHMISSREGGRFKLTLNHFGLKPKKRSPQHREICLAEPRVPSLFPVCKGTDPCVIFSLPVNRQNSTLQVTLLVHSSVLLFLSSSVLTRNGDRLDFYESGSGSAYRFRFLAVLILVPN